MATVVRDLTVSRASRQQIAEAAVALRTFAAIEQDVLDRGVTGDDRAFAEQVASRCDGADPGATHAAADVLAGLLREWDENADTEAVF